MILQGTPGQTKIIQIDPNNQRVALDTISGFKGGTFTQVTVNSSGQVIAGANPKPASTPSTPSSPSTPSGVTTIAGQAANYSGNPPGWFPPTGELGVAIDTSTGRVWWFFGGSWQ